MCVFRLRADRALARLFFFCFFLKKKKKKKESRDCTIAQPVHRHEQIGEVRR